MSDPEFSDLIKRIYQELAEIQRVLTRIHDGWERARRSHDDFYIDSVALNLHGFYSGFERIFIHIAETVDDKLPHGENWHELLLKQMMIEVQGVRPAVISTVTGRLLDECVGFVILFAMFTHITLILRASRNWLSAADVFQLLNAELSAFANFLQQA